MFCCIPLSKKKINNDYTKLDDPFSEIIEHIDNNNYTTYTYINNNNENNRNSKKNVCYLNSYCNHEKCDISYFKNKILELEKQLNFYKVDNNNLLQNNLIYQKNIEEINKLVYFKTSLINDYKIKINNINYELEHINNLNNKLNNLNQLLNEKNKSLIKENNLKISNNEYLNQSSNKNLKEKFIK